MFFIWFRLKFILISNNDKNKFFRNVLAFLALIIGLFVPFLAQAYTGITVVLSAQTQANQEFIDTFKAELVKAELANTNGSTSRAFCISARANSTCFCLP